jgi:murein L,D-transpeptidase YafK
MIPNNFLQQQLLFPRVEQASYQHNEHLLHLLKENQLNFAPQQLYIRIFKHEEILELWATDKKQFQLIKSYHFTKNSGKPGPKCCQGDLQIPEGFLA